MVRETTQSDVWNVSLFPVVQQVLAQVHEQYFKNLELWLAMEKESRGPPPSSVGCYKELLRRELSQRIADS